MHGGVKAQLLVSAGSLMVQFCSFKHSMLNPLKMPKHSAPNLYANDLARRQIVSLEIEYGSLITMDLG